MHKTNIITEIGFNHLGSKYLLDYLFDLIINNGFDLTFQIRSTDFPSKKTLNLSLDYIFAKCITIKKKEIIKSKIGFAIDSLDYIDEVSKIADFIKLLAFFEDKQKFLKDTKFANPIYVSLGLDPINKVREMSDAARSNSKKFHALYTSYDKMGLDISLKEINLISSFSDSISFGYHQNNVYKLGAISSLINFNNIFLYINPGFNDKNKLLPDSNHSLKIEEILRLRETFNFQEKISLNSNRETFKTFKND